MDKNPMDLVYEDFELTKNYPHKLVDLIDETEFGILAHKVREFNDRLEPVQWELLKELLSAYLAKIEQDKKSAVEKAFDEGAHCGYASYNRKYGEDE